MVKTFLLVDTCTENGFTALFQEGKIAFQAFLGDTFDSAQALIPILHTQLQENSCRWDTIDGIAVTAGPGSYTGMRLGIIAAKCLAYSLKKPLIGIPSTEIYVPHGISEGRFAVLLDARMGGAYCSLGTIGEGLVFYEPPFLQSLDSLSETLEGIQQIVSPHSKRLKERAIALREKEWHEVLPSPLHMGEAAQQRWNRNEYSQTADLEILYLRRTQAEIERDKRD